MGTLDALRKILARIEGNPKYSKALSRPRTTSHLQRADPPPIPQWDKYPRSEGGEITRGQLRSLMEAKGQTIGDVRKNVTIDPQQLEKWLIGGADDEALRPHRGMRSRLAQIIDWLEGLE